MVDNPKDVHLAGGDAAYLVDEQTVGISIIFISFHFHFSHGVLALAC